MIHPIQQELKWQVRICRTAFQDFQRIFRRYYARSIFNRQLLKLRWWDPEATSVIDLRWNSIPDTHLMELLVMGEGELTNPHFSQGGTRTRKPMVGRRKPLFR